MEHFLQTLVFIGAKCMAAVMDFGIGALIAVSTLLYFDQEVAWYTFIIGGFMALIPDMDVLPSMMRGKSLEFDHHQTLFHHPLVILPIAVIGAYLLGGFVWALIAAISITYHFLHDTGWFTDTTGISWLWPFSKRCWTWHGSYPVPGHIDQHVWLGRHWLRPTTKGMIEIGVGVTALGIVVYLQNFTSLLPVLLANLILLGTAFVWLTARQLSKSRQTET